MQTSLFSLHWVRSLNPSKQCVGATMNKYEGRITYIESLKFPTTPGLSPGVGLRKQGLLALQMMPCTQGSVPAEGMALFGKWPWKFKHHTIMVSFKFTYIMGSSSSYNICHSHKSGQCCHFKHVLSVTSLSTLLSLEKKQALLFVNNHVSSFNSSQKIIRLSEHTPCRLWHIGYSHHCSWNQL